MLLLYNSLPAKPALYIICWILYSCIFKKHKNYKISRHLYLHCVLYITCIYCHVEYKRLPTGLKCFRNNHYDEENMKTKKFCPAKS